MSFWTQEIFQTKKPVIAMAHVPALPGTPRYDARRGMNHILEWVFEDVHNLVQSGVDAIMFCNEDDRPYVFKAATEQIAALTRVVSETAPKSMPFGVDFLWDPMAAIVIAHATGASFVREVLSGVYESDMGLWSPDAGEVMRKRQQIGAGNIRVLFNIVPEFATSLGSRSLAQRARSALVSCLADAILVSGPMAGQAPELALLKEVKDAVPEVPVLLNTGANLQNLETYLPIADGVIVGSSLKIDGSTWNRVDPSRVKAFMDQARMVRDQLVT